MQRNSAHITTLIILLSIITVSLQSILYYFIGAGIVTFCLTALIIAILSHLLLTQSLSYETCFGYTLLNVFVSAVIISLSYFGGKDSFLPYDFSMLYFIVIDWAITIFYCILRCLFDWGYKFKGFNSYYRNSSILFLIFYLITLAYFQLYDNNALTLVDANWNSINIVPALTVSTVIQGYFDQTITLNTMVQYFIERILLFAPYGFYVALGLRRCRRLVRFIVILFLPIVIEVVQSLFLLGKGDIDDFILAFIGSILGALFYHLQNSIFRWTKDENFLNKRTGYNYRNSSLHF